MACVPGAGTVWVYGDVIPGSVQTEELTSWVRALGARSLPVRGDVKISGFYCQRLRGPWPIAGEILESEVGNGEDPGAAT